MSKKNHSPGPIPQGNRPAGIPGKPGDKKSPPIDEARLQDEDPKRNLGGFTGKGEHSIQQPGGKNDADH